MIVKNHIIYATSLDHASNKFSTFIDLVDASIETRHTLLVAPTKASSITI